MVVKCCSCVSFLLSSKCCHTWKSSAETFTIWRFAMFKAWYLGHSWKFDEVVLQAVGILKMCTGFLIVMNDVAFLGHIRVMVLAGVESGVVGIQTSGDICVGWYTSEVFLICNKHCKVIPARFFTYRAVIHDGGFSNGWKGVGILHNCLFAAWQTWNWVGEVPLPWFHP